jgi:hypothetical protein
MGGGWAKFFGEKWALTHPIKERLLREHSQPWHTPIHKIGPLSGLCWDTLAEERVAYNRLSNHSSLAKATRTVARFERPAMQRITSTSRLMRL